ncbi:Lon protease family protein [Sulfuricystis multivorans]|uniref:Lon protease family protein n=1 Tax=Sulfuricystis multivorans TaxID=2211108 RepID=UPI000F82D346|nr:ATP-binding protein [Sulfuricystis multivorans]
MTVPAPLSPDQLGQRCDPAQLGFATTDEVLLSPAGIAQQRARAALHFALETRAPGFNAFLLGEPGYGRHRLVARLLDELAPRQAVPPDLCYVYNFADSNRPRLLILPPGRGARLKADMQRFVAELAKAIAAAFESDTFRGQAEALQEEYKEREDQALRRLGQTASENGIALLRTPQGFMFAPLKGEETMGPDDFEALPDAEKERLNKLIEAYGEKLRELLHQFPRWRRELQARLLALSRETMTLAVGHLIEELKAHYVDLINVVAFLDEVMRDVVDSAEELRETKGEAEGPVGAMAGNLPLSRYQVNLLIDHGATQGAPIVFEDPPSFQNLIGRVDHIAHMGTLITHFTMIRAGALQRANGGYLVLDADKLLGQPYAWEGLKRALRARQVRIESLGQIFGLLSTLTIEPEPIPLDLKVILIGERHLYYLLKEYDPEFEQLFKVAADFDDVVPREAPTITGYASFIASEVRAKQLRPFDAAAVARVIDHAARLADDAARLTTATRQIADLLVEADFHAAQAQHPVVGAADVDDALAARRARSERLQRLGIDEIRRGVRLIDLAGSQVGQINGLVVYDLAGERFGQPVRISATIRLGEGEVIDIEREAELGGPIHSKGVMILASFLAARYARLQPFSLTASLVFEQSYGPVEGDSASLAELAALLSALANAPIRQGIAVTGSVNQFGQVQAIGGVNEKVEGFFDTCQATGLTGEQGVIIPIANLEHLMLRPDVVEACAAGRFHLWAVANVDQAIELLTGVPAGMPDEQGNIPPGTINYLIAVQLAEMAALRQAFAEVHGGGHKKQQKKH